MRSCQHPTLGHGISCFHHGPSRYGRDEVQSNGRYVTTLIKCKHLQTTIGHSCGFWPHACLQRVRVTMTSPNIGRSKYLNQNGPKKNLPKVSFSSPTLHRKIGNYTQVTISFAYLCVCGWAPKLILPLLVVGFAFTAGFAAFMPVVPRDTWCRVMELDEWSTKT